ncbi:cellulose binding domain-containing protein [Streptomyces griseochromogenes]|uniref:cellulose binding domain-containing protein n=1 Tax=Streptomyces griseochromogenes TaxID=68214 RepID=UPI003797D911
MWNRKAGRRDSPGASSSRWWPIIRTWNADRTQPGATVSCRNGSCNGPVPDGGSVAFGFNASWSGSDPVPTVAVG